MKVMKEFKNNLLKRKEVVFSVEANSNPGYQKVQEYCVGHFKVETDRVVIKKLWGKFGSNEFFTEAFIYDSIADKERNEPKPKVKKEKAIGK